MHTIYALEVVLVYCNFWGGLSTLIEINFKMLL